MDYFRIKVLTVLTIALSLSAKAQCVVSSANSTSTMVNDISIGSLAWGGLGNAQGSDNSYASAGQLLGVLTTIQSNYIKCTNFGFSIPNTASICGIEVEVERHCSGLLIGSSVSDNRVYIVKNNVIGGTDHALAGTWPSSDAYVNYGSSGDAWGTTWAPADINSSNFGIAISAKASSGLAGLFLTASIDHVKITVHYNPTVLPVELKDIKCIQENDKVKVEWEVDAEQNIQSYSLEKMLSETEWITISSTAPGQKKYSLFDESAQENNYYRLKIMEADGRFSYSKVVYTNFYPKDFLLSPNPAIDLITIKSADIISRIEIFNSSMSIIKTIGVNDISASVDISEIEKGYYFVKVISETTTSFKKLVKN